jgi:hypothetical protein
VPVDPARLAEQRAGELLEVGDVRAAREVIEEALRTSQSRTDLLWILADVEFAAGDQQTGIRCLTEAVSASRRDAAAISKQIQTLSERLLWHETLGAIERIPTQVRGDPQVRTAVGGFYRARGCHGHAVSGYGSSAGLAFSIRAKRCLSWLRSGGPFTFVRRRINAWEDSEILPGLRRDRRSAGKLEAVSDLDSSQAYILNVRMENANYEWSYRSALWTAIFRWQLRLLPAAFVPVWLVLYAIVSAVAFISGPPNVVGGTQISGKGCAPGVKGRGSG